MGVLYLGRSVQKEMFHGGFGITRWLFFFSPQVALKGVTGKMDSGPPRTTQKRPYSSPSRPWNRQNVVVSPPIEPFADTHPTQVAQSFPVQHPFPAQHLAHPFLALLGHSLFSFSLLAFFFLFFLFFFRFPDFLGKGETPEPNGKKLLISTIRFLAQVIETFRKWDFP